MADSKIIALKNKANRAKAENDIAGAIEYYKEIIQLDPDDPNIPKEIGSLYVKIGEEDNAREFYWKSLEQYKDLEYYQNATAIAQILIRLGTDALEIQQELAELYVKQDLIGDAVATFEGIAENYKKDGDIEGVLENLRKIVDLTPKRVGIRLKLVDIFKNQNRTHDAILELKQVKEIYKEQGRVDKADGIQAKIDSLAREEKGEKETVVFQQETVDLEEKKTLMKEPSTVEREEFQTVEFEEAVEFGEVEAVSLEGIEEIEEEFGEFLKIDQEGLVEPGVREVEESITNWDDWINLADLYISVGSEEEAIEYYYKAAEALFMQKKYEDAYRTYLTISELKPEGLIERQKMIQSALKLNSRSKAVEAYMSLYHCLIRKGASEEADKIFDKARRIDPDSPLVKEVVGEEVHIAEKAKGKKITAVDFDKLFEEEIAEEEEMKVGLEEAQDLDTLLAEFKRKALEEIPDSDYSSHFGLGITYQEMELFDEAIQEFKRSMEGERWRLKSLEMMGKCYEMQGKIEDAENLYRGLLISKKYGEDEIVAFAYYLGNLYSGQNQFAKALNEYKKVVRLDPDFVDIKERIKFINKRLSGSAVEESLTALSEDISKETSHLWESVLEEKGKEVEDKNKDIKKKEKKEKKEKKGKISYI